MGIAVSSGHRPQVIAALLGALLAVTDASAQSPQEAARGPELGMALLSAAGDGNTAGVSAALGQGADVDFRNDEGWTALLFAAIRGFEEVAALLIEAGADVDVQGVNGATALMAAAVMGELEIAEMLLEAGSDPGLRNLVGATARVKAKEYRHFELAELLARYELALREPAALEIDPINAEYVIRKGANLRSAPHTDARRVGSLPVGTTVTVTGKVRGRSWYRIDNGLMPAFVHEAVLAEPGPAPDAQPP